MLSVFGPEIKNPTNYTGAQGQGLFDFLGNILKFAAVAGGIYMIIQIILAGFDYMNAAGDSKKLETAWAKIWQSLIGLAIISAAFIIAGVIGRLTGLNILTPTIYGPNQ
ncbi:MAG TPA: hypothetical protein VN174_02815 [Candidatus Methanoperedens sp.]|nr:hypothetical protein [Candidatus Methanoperedens sp.]